MSDEPDDTEEDDGPEEKPEWWLSSETVLENALEITQEYLADGVTLGLRALYYQFVGRGIVDPRELAITDKKGKTVGAHRFYKRIGRICAEARYDGKMPMDALADTGREVREGDFTREDNDVDSAHQTAGAWIRGMNDTLMNADKWVDQPWFVSVWVEKDGLAPVVEPVCREHGVSFFPAKGYPSVSALWQWLEFAQFACGTDEENRGFHYGAEMNFSERHIGGTLATEADVEEIRERSEATWEDVPEVGDRIPRKAVILYFGDADPDGYEIPRSSERGLRRLMETHGIDIELTVIRIALTIAQARELKLPPFEAKMTSARYAKYRREHNTDDAWELDALDMRMLRKWVADAIKPYWDAEIGARVQAERNERAAELRRRIADPQWIRRVFDGDAE